jgi:LuxR family transcriptional regulator, maltose regulon positive regulatory protein
VEDNTPGLRAVPRPLDAELPRLRLADRLRARWCRPITLVTAGAGFGKTTALAQAVRANLLEPQGVDAWVTCGPGHEDAVRLATAILHAFGADPGSEPGAREALAAPRRSTSAPCSTTCTRTSTADPRSSGCRSRPGVPRRGATPPRRC